MRKIALVVLFVLIFACSSFAQADSVEKPKDPPMTSPAPEKNRIIPDLGIEFVYVKAGTFRMGSANRGGGTPTGRFYSYGFRVVLAYPVNDLGL